MKRFAMTLGVLSMAFPMLAVAQTSTWVPDKAHSEVDFGILHMSLSKVHGRFGNIGGQIVWNDADITKSTVNVTIDVASVDTGVAPRDTDLKSAGMFRRCAVPDRDLREHERGEDRQRSDRQRQPDSAWRHKARGVAGRGSDWTASRHGRQDARGFLSYDDDQPDSI